MQAMFLSLPFLLFQSPGGCCYVLNFTKLNYGHLLLLRRVHYWPIFSVRFDCPTFSTIFMYGHIYAKIWNVLANVWRKKMMLDKIWDCYSSWASVTRHGKHLWSSWAFSLNTTSIPALDPMLIMFFLIHPTGRWICSNSKSRSCCSSSGSLTGQKGIPSHPEVVRSEPKTFKNFQSDEYFSKLTPLCKKLSFAWKWYVS